MNRSQDHADMNDHLAAGREAFVRALVEGKEFEPPRMDSFAVDGLKASSPGSPTFANMPAN